MFAHRLLPKLILILFMVLGWFYPPPTGLNAANWHLLILFMGTILSFVLLSYPMGPVVLSALVLSVLTHTLPMDTALAGYGDHTVWLVVAAFLIAGAVKRTGLGKRLALLLVCRLGHSLLGLGYAICCSELVLGPLVPSNTARGAGILAPIVRSLAESLDAKPGQDEHRAGLYLSLVGAHANLIAAAMFLTGMAANPLVEKAAKEILGVDFGWQTWALGAIMPGLLGMVLLPLFLQKLLTPSLVATEQAHVQANHDLGTMGSWTSPEKYLLGVLGIALLLWATKSWHGLDTTLVAWMALLAILFTHVQTWHELMSDSAAWDTLIWLGGLLALGNALKTTGVVSWFANLCQQVLSQTHLIGLPLVIVLVLIYFYSMYGFSMLTAHISALVGAFFTLSLAAQAPPLVVAALFAYFSNLCACLTNYSSGPEIVYYGLGYSSTQTWFKIGAWVSLLHITLWLGGGLLWWKILGWW